MIELRSLWRGPAVRPEVERRLEQLAFDRLRLFVPIVIFGILVALVVSGPAGIPVPTEVVGLNAGMIVVALSMYMLLRTRTIPARFAHATSAVVWLLAPINTMSSMAITGQATLVLPLMVEIATAALLLDTVWTFAAMFVVVIIGIPLSRHAGSLQAYPISLVGIATVAMIMQVWLRRWTIRAETHRVDLERAAEVLARELDERERLRDQFVHAQRMEAVGTLAAGLAHDMNNILGGILAYADVLHGDATDNRVKEDLASIRAEAERGAQLTRSLLAFSRRGQYRKRPILLHSVIDDITPLMARTLGKSVTIVRSYGPAVAVDADPAQLGQVILNMCLNAADAMERTGTVTIRTDEVKLAASEIDHLPAGYYAKIGITDTGTGMDAETKRRAFEPFFTTKPVGKGTGLGLAMAIGAVQAHGGAITVDSEPGKGTTMSIYVPATQAIPVLPASERATTPRKNRGLVLVVDDEPVVRAATARLIEKLGLTVITANDGEQAIERYKECASTIVLVLLDMVMPRMSGPDCYRELRKLGRTPVLLVSGFAADVAAQDLLEEGADGFLEKPFTREQLAGEIDRLLGRAPAGATPTTGSR